MVSIYDTGVLLRVVRNLKQPTSFLMDMFFPFESRSDDEFIHFDFEEGKRRIAVFVSPIVEGKIVEREGFKTDTYKAPYIKLKEQIRPRDNLKRRIGEMIQGNMTPAQREQATLGQVITELTEMTFRRKELMAAHALVDAQLQVSGEGFATQNISFGRDAGHSVTLAGAARWGEAGVKPLDNIEDWASTVLQGSGAPVTDVVMTPDAWKLFRVDADVKELLDTRRGSTATAELGPTSDVGGVFKGQIGQFRFWEYQDWYVDPSSGTETPFLPAHTVLLGSEQIEGVRAYAAIEDVDSGFAPEPIWPKSWTVDDPSTRWVMTQSAPLLVPTRPNASFRATVRS